jgi:putative flippase GtrA
MKTLNKIFALIKRKEIGKELIKYASVGFLGVCVNLVILYSITEFFKIHYLISASIAFVVAGFQTFTLDKIWTFHEDIGKGFLKELIYFSCFGGISFLIGISAVYIFTNFFEFYYVVGQLFAIFIMGSFTFTCNELWTFRNRRG